MGTALTPAVEAGRWEPALMRRKLTGTIFYGICLTAIAILILALIALLLNVLVVGLPWLNADFITGVPSRRPENAGIWPALVGSIQLAMMTSGRMTRARVAAPANRTGPRPSNRTKIARPKMP